MTAEQQPSAEKMVRNYVITDDLEAISQAINQLSEPTELTQAVKSFLQGRYHIETTWDYATTYEHYQNALEILGRRKPSADRTDAIANWLNCTVVSHLLLQEAEANWTLCNFAKADEKYLAASEGFLQSEKVAEHIALDGGFGEPIVYSHSWGMLAKGMQLNMLGYAKLRNRNAEDASSQFTSARECLTEADRGFVQIRNLLGSQDARSYVVNEKEWMDQKFLLFTAFSVAWKEYLFFNRDAVFEKILSHIKNVHVTQPSQIMIPEFKEGDFRIMTATIGQVKLSEIGDIELPPVTVKINFHPDYLIEIEYGLHFTQPLDAFTLYLLKILNTEAVPTYNIHFKDVETISEFDLENCRLKDVTTRVFEELISVVGESDTPQITDSFVLIQLHSYAPQVEPSKLFEKEYRYLGSLFSTAETFAWQSLLKQGKEEFENLAEEVERENAIFYLSDNSSIFVVPYMQEWKVKLYAESLGYILSIRNSITRLTSVVGQQSDNIGSRLQLLRGVILRREPLAQQYIHELILRNLDVRLYVLRILEIRRKLESLKGSGINEIRRFVERASSRLGLAERFQRTDSLIEKVETLYTTVYNLGEQYLSLIIAVNSDISRRAFSTLNIIMMGSLGLSVTTAVLQTPVQFTFAALGVFTTSSLGYLYLWHVRHNASRLTG